MSIDPAKRARFEFLRSSNSSIPPEELGLRNSMRNFAKPRETRVSEDRLIPHEEFNEEFTLILEPLVFARVFVNSSIPQTLPPTGEQILEELRPLGRGSVQNHWPPSDKNNPLETQPPLERPNRCLT